MFGFIFSIMPFIFILYYMRIVSKSKYVSSDLKSGEICYSCKEKIEVDRECLIKNLIYNNPNYSLCQLCKRDEKIDEIVNNRKLSIINKFKLYLIGDRYNRLFKILIVLLIIFCIIDVTLRSVFDIKGFNYFYNTFLFCYWALLIYRNKLISIKKTL